MKAFRPVDLHLVKALLFALAVQLQFSSQAQPTSWNAVLANIPVQITSMAYGNGTFVGCGSGWRFVSENGSNWTVYANAPIINQGGVAYGNGQFYTFGTNAEKRANYILMSTNGTTWVYIYTSSNTLYAGAYGNNTWVFIGTNYELVTANMTITNWVWSEFQTPFSPNCITYGNGNFVIGAIVGSTFVIFTSSDGITWQYRANLQGNISSPTPFEGITYGNGVFVASVSSLYSGRMYTSSNLVNWSTNAIAQPISPTAPYSPIAFGGNTFSAGINTSSGSVFYSSTDGYNWSNNFGLSAYMTTLTYGQGTFVATIGTSIYQSNVFATNSSPSPTTLGFATYPGVTINGTPGSVYQIQNSTSLTGSWQTLTNFMLPYTPYLWIDTSSTVSGQRFYRSVQVQ